MTKNFPLATPSCRLFALHASNPISTSPVCIVGIQNSSSGGRFSTSVLQRITFTLLPTSNIQKCCPNTRLFIDMNTIMKLFHKSNSGEWSFKPNLMFYGWKSSSDNSTAPNFHYIHPIPSPQAESIIPAGAEEDDFPRLCFSGSLLHFFQLLVYENIAPILTFRSK